MLQTCVIMRFTYLNIHITVFCVRSIHINDSNLKPDDIFPFTIPSRKYGGLALRLITLIQKRELRLCHITVIDSSFDAIVIAKLICDWNINLSPVATKYLEFGLCSLTRVRAKIICNLKQIFLKQEHTAKIK